MIAERWLLFEPLDTVTVRDGRPFDAGQDSVARTVLPSPTTLGGAVGAAYGAAPGAGLRADARGVEVPSRLAGPFTVTGDGRVVWPVPRDVVVTDAGTAVPPERLRVKTVVPDGVVDDLRPCSGRLVGDGDPVEGWWDLRALQGYLSMGKVSPDYRREPPWKVERRVGLAGEDGGGAADGLLYATEHLRLDPGAGFAVRCLDGPDVPPARTVAFGGRGRGAQVRELAAPALPEPAATATGGRLLLYLATPAVFTGGWLPDLSVWPGCELVAAATGGPQVITTITADRFTGGFRGRGRLLWAVPAGGVYYLRFPSETAALAAARALAREPLRQAEETLATAGFGWTFTGSW
ncbi:CRISPR-associated protein Cmr3 [Actinomadura pelletieri DSM 43383]|uniref:CRISPR-associated protein Cmr3 n=1 Tax=Actinomadura pelletieri DSM 43383 TaxID=1120940 RepID=A0A495Q9T3_9ACTN|nr:type III-B CRISPR module-associated Cmr3 family protein [Actinomadura pelletieri]RKS68253.1 CRISPR-associated protein Cmr3 [Actinomadura pelletieri DSM 43383]